MSNYFRRPDNVVDAVRAVLSGQPTETQKEVDAALTQEADEKKHGKGDPMVSLDPVDKKALKGKHKDRKDKDIDNDGDVDGSDEYLHKRRKAVSKAVNENGDHDHDHDDEEDDDKDEKKSKKKKVTGDDEDTSKEDEENAKKKKTSGKQDTVDLEPKMADQKLTAEAKMTPAQEKKREEIVMSMKEKMPEFKKKYGDRARDVMYATATKLAMKDSEEDVNERNKANAMRRKTADAARGARYKLNNPVGDPGKKHSNPQAHNKAIGRALRRESVELEENNKEKYKWDDINKAMTHNNMSPRQIMNILSTLNKMKKGTLKLSFKEEVTESTKEYGKSMRKVAFDKQMSNMSSKDKSTVSKLADLMKREREKAAKKEETEVAEGTWSIPNTPKKKAELKKILSKPLPVGKEGDGASKVMGNIIGDDELMDDFYSLFKKSGPKADGRPAVKAAMKRLRIKEEVEEAKSPSYEVDIIAKDFIKQGAKSKDAYREAMKLAKKMSNREKQDIIKKGKSSLMYLKLKEEVEVDESWSIKMPPAEGGKTVTNLDTVQVMSFIKSKGGTDSARKAIKKGQSVSFQGKRGTMYKIMKEEVEVDEGRGRPRKDGTKSASDDREHIQMQLRKSVSLRGQKHVEFDDGKKVKVPSAVARAVSSKIDGIKDAKQKQNAVQHISKSHKHMMDFHKGDYKDKEQRRQDAINAPFKKK